MSSPTKAQAQRWAAQWRAQLTARGLRFCFIGGIASFRWGTPRLTGDLDLTVLTGFGGEEPVITTLLDDLSPRIADAADIAWRHRVLLLRTADGIAVGFAGVVTENAGTPAGMVLGASAGVALCGM